MELNFFQCKNLPVYKCWKLNKSLSEPDGGCWSAAPNADFEQALSPQVPLPAHHFFLLPLSKPSLPFLRNQSSWSMILRL